MKTLILVLSVLLSAAPFAGARGRGFAGGRVFSGGRAVFSGARRGGVVRGTSASRGSPRVFGGFSRGVSRPSFARSTASRPSSRSGFFSAAGARSASIGFGRPLTRPSFARSTPSRVAANGTTRGISRADSGGSSAPAWATPGALIRSAGQPPVYSDPGNSSTHSVDGGGFIAMDQSRALDVGRSPGITHSAPDRTMSTASSGGGGGSGASSNGPAFNPAF